MRYLYSFVSLAVVTIVAILLQGVTSVAKSSSQPNIEVSTGSILLSSNAIVLAPGSQATIQATLRNELGVAVPNAEIQFAVTNGHIPTTAVTDGGGTVKVTFTAGNMAALTVVTASSHRVTQKLLVQVKSPIQNQAPNLTLTINQTELKRGEESGVNVQLIDVNGQPMPGILITFFGSLGEVASASIVTDINGQAETSYRAGSISGTATVTVMAQNIAQTKHVIIAQEGMIFTEQIFLPMITR